MRAAIRLLQLCICVNLTLAQSCFANQDVFVKFRARVQLDAHDFSYPRKSDDTLDTSFAELRRARIENTGVFYNTFKYKISADVADEVSLEDAYISLQGDTLRLQAGQFYYPFGNETQGSSKDSEFLEKASIASLVSYGRDRGISLQTYHSRYLFLQAGVVQGAGPNSSDNNHVVDKVIRFGLDTNPRGRIAQRFLIGFSAASGRQKARSGDSISIKSESHSELTLFNAPLKTDTDYLRSRFAIESTYLKGPFMFKPEFFYDHYVFDESVNILGYYLIGSYFLSGEQRSLNNGLLTRQQVFHPISRGGWGAWEVATRFSSYAVSSQFYHDDTLYLGWQALSRATYPQRGHSLSLGMNWYPHPLIRMMLNNVISFTQHATENRYEIRERAWLLRVQLEY